MSGFNLRRTMVISIFTLSACVNHEIAPSALTAFRSKTGLNYAESFQKWEELKRMNGNSYTYTSSFTSWTGFGTITEIEVINGIVVSRQWTSFVIEQSKKEVTGSYFENQANLNTHEQGEPPLTIDELYQTCAREYLVADVERNIITFETSETGLLWFCGYTPKMCADDCYQGINIGSFEWK
jgi:hypothetical protein